MTQDRPPRQTGEESPTPPPADQTQPAPSAVAQEAAGLNAGRDDLEMDVEAPEAPQAAPAPADQPERATARRGERRSAHVLRAEASQSRRARLGAVPPATPHFSQPVRQILLMLAVLALVIGGGWLAYGRIFAIFAANPVLNGVIIAVFIAGLIACFWQVAQLTNSVAWIERFAARRGADADTAPVAEGRAPRLLAPLASLLGRQDSRGVISTGAARSMLDSVATRIDEARDITRYIANLLIFLGLLGTFYGLATTVPAVVETIRALAPQEGDSAMAVFDKLMSGLESQLGGMATAFSSSLLGLAGSLVVGLLDLFATHGQNRFYRELEEWMSGFTRLGLAGNDQDEPLDQAALAGFLDEMMGLMRQQTQIYAERDEMREAEAIEADERVLLMARSIEGMTDRLAADLRHEAQSRSRAEADLAAALTRLAEGQATLDRALGNLPDSIATTLADTQARGAGEQAEAVARLAAPAIGHLERIETGVAAQRDQLDRLTEAPALAAKIDELTMRLDRLMEAAAQGLDISMRQTQAVQAQRDALAKHLATQTAPDGDAEARMHLRSVDAQLGRLSEELALGRQDMMVELRADLHHIARVLQRINGAG